MLASRSLLRLACVAALAIASCSAAQTRRWRVTYTPPVCNDCKGVPCPNCIKGKRAAVEDTTCALADRVCHRNNVKLHPSHRVCHRTDEYYRVNRAIRAAQREDRTAIARAEIHLELAQRALRAAEKAQAKAEHDDGEHPECNCNSGRKYEGISDCKESEEVCQTCNGTRIANNRWDGRAMPTEPREFTLTRRGITTCSFSMMEWRDDTAPAGCRSPYKFQLPDAGCCALWRYAGSHVNSTRMGRRPFRWVLGFAAPPSQKVPKKVTNESSPADPDASSSSSSSSPPSSDWSFLQYEGESLPTEGTHQWFLGHLSTSGASPIMVEITFQDLAPIDEAIDAADIPLNGDLKNLLKSFLY